MKKINKKNILFILVFIIGFLLTVYPLISQWYYRIEAKDEVDKFNAGTEELDSSEIQRRIELARAYNSSLDPSKLSDPYTEKEKEGRAEYARMLEVEEMIGHVEVPKIGEDLPIYAGTSDDILARGAGHLEGTSLPVGGASTHAVITAHRGLPSATLFRHLDDLDEGDVFFIHNIETTLAYKVDQITTVEPWDFEKVLVISGKDYVTLLTCTPYMINSHRLLVRGHRIEYTPAVQEEALKQNKRKINYLKLLIISLIILIVLIIIWFRERKKFRSLRKR
ncbi:class C sortase [Peptoniphilus raoultii]|uniref:class C sortase n=1 Tax=Peptoniphilus raoultii TaxID=1776387 RepID=UPI0008D9A1AC|nr:class C sortase [Peptoniphilus raoultii]